MAKLHFYYASTDAGKSATLIEADFNYRAPGVACDLDAGDEAQD